MGGRTGTRDKEEDMKQGRKRRTFKKEEENIEEKIIRKK